MISNKTVVHVTDMRTEKAYANRDPYIVAGVEQLGLFGPRTTRQRQCQNAAKSVGLVRKFARSPRAPSRYKNSLANKPARERYASDLLTRFKLVGYPCNGITGISY